MPGMDRKTKRRRVATIERKSLPRPTTYTSLHYHFTFSTKNREPWITTDIENRVWAYIGGVARAHKMTALQVGGIEDHLHAAVMAPPRLSPSQIAQYLKGDSSNKSQLPDLIKYIENQRKHHRKKSFKEEYVELLKKHGVDYDERYLWG